MFVMHGIRLAKPQHWSHSLPAVTKIEPQKITNDEHMETAWNMYMTCTD
jgi:hypothetical protein